MHLVARVGKHELRLALFLPGERAFCLITRRRFLGQSALTAAASFAPATLAQSLPQTAPPAKAKAVPNLDPTTLTPFVDPLPLPPVAKPIEHRPAPGNPAEKVPFYRVSMRAITAKLHRDLPPTHLWSYGGSVPGPTFDTRSGQGQLIEWVNDLPARHFLPIDHSLHGAEKSTPEVRAVVHLHGGKTPPESDGYPEDWYVPGQSAHLLLSQPPGPGHCSGITTTPWASIASTSTREWWACILIRDAVEDALNLPRGKYEIPLVIMDRVLRADGQLDYPVSRDPERALGSRSLRRSPRWSTASSSPISKSSRASTASAS